MHRSLVGSMALALFGVPSAQVSSGAPSSEGVDDLLDAAVAHAAERMTTTSHAFASSFYPKNTSGYSVWTVTTASDWASGFFPGAHWLLYELTGDASHRSIAEAWLVALAPQQFNTTTHDVGFQFLSGFGNGYRSTGDPSYRAAMLQAAISLSTRFDPDVGCIRSWSWGPWSFPVIVDNIMNLELLFWAARNGGEQVFHDMAVSHALVTRREHVRADGSTFHLVDFDPTTGAVSHKQTWSGVSTASTWSRGQAWAIYGFAVAYRETLDARFLATAELAADYWAARVPPDGVPFWDFDAPGIPDTERDSSAAAIAASGLLELSKLSRSPVKRSSYFALAEATLASLATDRGAGGYLSRDASGAPISPGVLMHGCGGHPNSWSGAGVPNESLIWGDYYFLEAVRRFRAPRAPFPAQVAGPPKVR